MVSIEISVVMPLFNEAKAIEQVLSNHIQALKQLNLNPSQYEVLCLDDGSTDGTWAALELFKRSCPQLRLIKHPFNLGIVPSFQQLFIESKGRLIYVTAGDGQWPASDLKILYNELKFKDADLVIGIRQDREKVYNFWRRCLSYGFNIFARLCLGMKVEDINGIKLGVREVFVQQVSSTSFVAEIERVYAAKRKGLKICFADVEFKSRASGVEKGAKFKNVLLTLKDLLRFFLFRPKYKQ